MWGAILGAGAAVLGGFFTGGVTWGLLAAGLAGGAAGFGAQVAIEKVGSTLLNDAKKNGINEQQLYELANKDQKSRDKWLDDNNEIIKSNNDRIKKLEEENKNLTEQIGKENDPTEKAKLVAIINENKKEIQALRLENNDVRKNTGDIIKQLPTNRPLSQAEFNDVKNKPSLSSGKNWGIIALFVFIGIMLLVFIKKIFSKFLGKMFE